MKWVNVNLGHSWDSHLERSAKICGNHFEEISRVNLDGEEGAQHEVGMNNDEYSASPPAKVDMSF